MIEWAEVTDRFTATFGVNRGYSHSNESEMTLHMFACAWSAAQPTGYYVSAAIYPAVAVYPATAGCPDGGETIFIVQGVRNPDYSPDADKWREVVRLSVERLKYLLEQTTAQVAFDKVEMLYMKGSP